jgi:hypothetical protein
VWGGGWVEVEVEVGEMKRRIEKDRTGKAKKGKERKGKGA